METNFKNECQYNRAEHNTTNFYTCISNILIQDTRLDFIEIGIMTKILSNVDSYVFNSTYFYNNTTLSKQQYFNAIDNLCLYGYLEKIKIASGWKWVINETAVEPTVETKQKILDRIETKDNKRKLRSKTNSFINPLISTGVNDTGVNDTGVNDTGVNDTGVNDTVKIVTSSPIININEIIEKSDSSESDLNKINIEKINNNKISDFSNFEVLENVNKYLVLKFQYQNLLNEIYKEYNSIYNYQEFEVHLIFCVKEILNIKEDFNPNILVLINEQLINELNQPNKFKYKLSTYLRN